MGQRRAFFRNALFVATLALFATANAAGRPDFLASHLDTSVDPGVDFFEYANGGWLKAHPIPKSESAWGIGNEVNEELYARLRTISEAAATAGPSADADTRRIGDFWATAMDVAKADRLGVHPLDAELARIDAIRSTDDVLDTVFAFKPIGVGGLFRIGVSQDEKDSATMAVQLRQGGLGLPERDFYFNTEAGVAKIRAAYVAHLARTFELLGRAPADAKAAADRVMAFETALAQASRRLEALRDPEKNYNKMSPAELTAKYTPSIDWTARLAGWGLKPSYVIVGQPEFFAAEEKLLRETPLPVLQDYLRYHLVDAYAEYLSSDFDRAHFDFHGRAMSGQQEPRPRWKRVLDEQNDAMGMVLGRLFVKEYFPEASKQRYAAMVDAIRDTYRERIERLDWMGAATKTKALAKLASITPKVGYPDRWKDYSALVVGRDSYAANVMNAARWQFQDNLSKFGKPVDRTEWEMTPQTYNAYYNPSNNEIVFPAAIMQAPFFDPNADDAVNYGAMGAIIGHELTHGFDDQGAMFDSEGNMKNWWTEEDVKNFQVRTRKLAEQFAAFVVIDSIDLHLNGELTLGENIADLGGLTIAYYAYKKSLDGKPAPAKIDGFTGEQRFFLSWAQGWRNSMRPKSLINMVKTNPHSPARFRVIGPLSNMQEFYEAFDVKPGDKMYRKPEDRVQIW